jgi:cobalt-zinc-cadmium efflux system outer membrane protein
MNPRGALIVRRIILFSLLCSVPASVRAQVASGPPAQTQNQTQTVASVSPSGATPLTLTQVLDMAHRANPSLLSAAQHLSAVHAQETTAGLRVNPTGVIGTQMVTLDPGDPNGTYFYNFGVQRLFERGGKRQARLETAKSTTALTGFQIDDQRRQTDLAVRQAFSHMIYAQQALAISKDNLEGYRKTVDLMKVRLDVGAIDRTDFDRVELQLAGFESDMDNAQMTLKQGSIALQTLLGVATPSDSFAIAGALDPLPIPFTLEELRTEAIANRPDLKVAQAQVAVNSATVKMAQANGTADPTIEGEYERAGASNAFGGNINIPLRIFDRNQGEKERARYELESSRLAVTAAQNQVLSDVDMAWAAYVAARAQSERYHSKYVAEAAHVRDNLEFSYRNGNTTLLDYLSALSDYRQVNLASLNANLQLLLAIEQLSYATHKEIVP